MRACCGHQVTLVVDSIVFVRVALVGIGGAPGWFRHTSAAQAGAQSVVAWGAVWLGAALAALAGPGVALVLQGGKRSRQQVVFGARGVK